MLKDLPFEPRRPFSEAQISEVEGLVGRQLPIEYTQFLRSYGGPRIYGYVDTDKGRAIDFFLSFDQIKSRMRMYEDLREERILTIGSCFLGNLFVLYFDNSVRYIDYYGMTHMKFNDTGKVDDTFAGFLSRIVIVDR